MMTYLTYILFYDSLLCSSENDDGDESWSYNDNPRRSARRSITRSANLSYEFDSVGNTVEEEEEEEEDDSNSIM
jgi:hypothetical protein